MKCHELVNGMYLCNTLAPYGVASKGGMLIQTKEGNPAMPRCEEHIKPFTAKVKLFQQ